MSSKLQFKAFTLVEMMVVVAIVAILATLAIPNLLRSRMIANESAAQTVLKTISNGCEIYFSRIQSYPTSISDLTDAQPPFISDDYTASARSGYSFTCDTLEYDNYSCSCSPTICGLTGSKTYTITTGGILTSGDCS